MGNMDDPKLRLELKEDIFNNLFGDQSQPDVNCKVLYFFLFPGTISNLVCLNNFIALYYKQQLAKKLNS